MRQKHTNRKVSFIYISQRKVFGILAGEHERVTDKTRKEYSNRITGSSDKYYITFMGDIQ